MMQMELSLTDGCKKYEGTPSRSIGLESSSIMAGRKMPRRSLSAYLFSPLTFFTSTTEPLGRLATGRHLSPATPTSSTALTHCFIFVSVLLCSMLLLIIFVFTNYFWFLAVDLFLLVISLIRISVHLYLLFLYDFRVLNCIFLLNISDLWTLIHIFLPTEKCQGDPFLISCFPLTHYFFLIFWYLWFTDFHWPFQVFGKCWSKFGFFVTCA